jgi:SAM-dependent methyltransferase
MTVEAFYDDLSPFYHLIYPDWEASIQRQAADIDAILRESWGDRRLHILDATCGVGTQTLGLAVLGHTLTGSDLSARSIERARREAQKHSLDIPFTVADVRQLYAHHRRQFDAVLSCDNALPHLLTDAELLLAFEQLFACTRPGGGCLISVRDYDREERAGVQVKPYGIRVEEGVRYLVFQVWEFHGPIYDMALYFVEDRGGSDCPVRVVRTQYYAVGTERLLELMSQAGFVEVRRIDGRFYQPVLVGRRPAL